MTRLRGRGLRRGLSDLPGGRERAVLMAPPYLVLLRAGFGLPPTLPPARCALTAPFHPYPSTQRFALRSGHALAASMPGPALSEARSAESKGGIFSVPLSVRLPCPGVTRRIALWSSDFPPVVALSSKAPQAVKACRTEVEARRRVIVWLTATLNYRVRSGGGGFFCSAQTPYGGLPRNRRRRVHRIASRGRA